MIDNMKQLNIDLSMWGVTLSDEKLEKFYRYFELLVEWNEKMNLTAITEFDEVLKKHFLDSLALVLFMKEKNMLPDNIGDEDMEKVTATLIDVGTGAGFPGIPLAICFPNMKITLMDSLNKRINFLGEVINELGLTNCVAIHSRAEELGKTNSEHREHYDFCVSRAVANISTLSEYCIPFVKVGGYFIPYKSEKLEEELSTGSKAIDILGGKIERIISFDLPSSDIKRNLLCINKVKSTKGKYPRKAGLPGKEPL